MKKNLIIVIIIILVSLFATTMVHAKGTPKAIHDRDKETEPNFSAAENSAYPMEEEDVIGVHFHIAADATFVSIGCPSWNDDIGDLTLSLYAFEKDYATSISKEPLYRHEFENFEDNDYLGFEFPESDPLKAGQYVFTLSDGYDPEGGKVGLWTCNQYPGQHFYENGKYNKALSARMLVEFKGEAPEVPYGPLEAIEVEAGSAYTGPEPFLDTIIRFSDPKAEDLFALTSSNAIDDLYIEDDYLVVVVPETNDPYFTINTSYHFDLVPTEEYPIMLLRIKREAGAHLVGEIFFNTTDSPGPTAGSSVKFQYEDTTEWQDVVIDLSANRKYTGDLINFRLDIVDKSDIESTFWIDYILFFGTEEAAQNFKKEDFETLPTPEPTPEPTPTPVKTPTPEKSDDPKEDEKKDEVDKKKPSLWILIVLGLVIIVAVVVSLVMIKKKK